MMIREVLCLGGRGEQPQCLLYAVLDARAAFRRENSLLLPVINYPGGLELLHRQIATIGNTDFYFLH